MGEVLRIPERLVVAANVAQNEHIPTTFVGEAVILVNAGVEYVPVTG